MPEFGKWLDRVGDVGAKADAAAANALSRLIKPSGVPDRVSGRQEEDLLKPQVRVSGTPVDISGRQEDLLKPQVRVPERPSDVGDMPAGFSGEIGKFPRGSEADTERPAEVRGRQENLTGGSEGIPEKPADVSGKPEKVDGKPNIGTRVLSGLRSTAHAAYRLALDVDAAADALAVKELSKGKPVAERPATVEESTRVQQQEPSTRPAGETVKGPVRTGKVDASRLADSSHEPKLSASPVALVPARAEVGLQGRSPELPPPLPKTEMDAFSEPGTIGDQLRQYHGRVDAVGSETSYDVLVKSAIYPTITHGGRVDFFDLRGDMGPEIIRRLQEKGVQVAVIPPIAGERGIFESRLLSPSQIVHVLTSVVATDLGQQGLHQAGSIRDILWNVAANLMATNPDRQDHLSPEAFVEGLSLVNGSEIRGRYNALSKEEIKGFSSIFNRVLKDTTVAVYSPLAQQIEGILMRFVEASRRVEGSEATPFPNSYIDSPNLRALIISTPALTGEDHLFQTAMGAAFPFVTANEAGRQRKIVLAGGHKMEPLLNLGIHEQFDQISRRYGVGSVIASDFTDGGQEALLKMMGGVPLVAGQLPEGVAQVVAMHFRSHIGSTRTSVGTSGTLNAGAGFSDERNVSPGHTGRSGGVNTNGSTGLNGTGTDAVGSVPNVYHQQLTGASLPRGAGVTNLGGGDPQLGFFWPVPTEVREKVIAYIRRERPEAVFTAADIILSAADALSSAIKGQSPLELAKDLASGGQSADARRRAANGDLKHVKSEAPEPRNMPTTILLETARYNNEVDRGIVDPKVTSLARYLYDKGYQKVSLPKAREVYGRSGSTKSLEEWLVANNAQKVGKDWYLTTKRQV